MIKKSLSVVGLMAGLFLSPAAWGQTSDWPRRPLTILVPFDVGGSVDRLARGFSQFMAKQLGQPITVVDRPGAAGQIAMNFLLQQPPDGYTVVLTPATAVHSGEHLGLGRALQTG